MIIRRLDARAVKQVRTRLATLLLDAVADGHSLDFLAGLDDAQLDEYWSGVERDVARGTRVLLAAEHSGVLVGSVQRDLAPAPGPSRVRSSDIARRRWTAPERCRLVGPGCKTRQC